MIVACQWNRSSPAGPALHDVGGSFCRSMSSFWILLLAISEKENMVIETMMNMVRNYFVAQPLSAWSFKWISWYDYHKVWINLYERLPQTPSKYKECWTRVQTYLLEGQWPSLPFQTFSLCKEAETVNIYGCSKCLTWIAWVMEEIC